MTPRKRCIAFISLLSLAFQALGNEIDQGTLDYIASNLEIRYDVLDNFQDTWKSYRVRMTLTNAGSRLIPSGPWAIYLCHIRVIEPVHTKHYPKGYVIPGGHGIKVTHINGCQHKFEPIASFSGLTGSQSLVVEFDGENWDVARTDVMPNWYIAAEGLQARTITSTVGETLSFVGPFNAPNKWKRITGDKYNPYTPEMRFFLNDITDLKKPGQLIVPNPSEIIGLDETRKVNLGTGDWAIVSSAGLKKEANFLAGKLGLQLDYFSSFRQIHLQIGEVKIASIKSESREAYSLQVKADSQEIVITGQSPVGVFYGIQSLLSVNEPNGMVPNVIINDSPRYEFRGMELDVGRNFMPKSEVKKLIDAMAMYKLNKFHFHLTDDEGWRLEIPGLPELTEVGSKRCHDVKEEKCLNSQLGSGPGTGNSGSGFYTVEDYREILRYAEERHVEVIPEFDMPGHGHAAIKVMQARQKKYAAMGQAFEADQYLLSDPLDTSQYLSVQFFSDNAINPCLESTYEFLEHVVNSVRHMHHDIQPLKIFHFGGDEVAHGAWTKSPACKRLAQKLGLNFTSPTIVKDLKEYFVRRVSEVSHRYCLDLGAWEDGVLGVKDTPYDRSYLKNENVYAHAWDNVWEWGQGDRAYKLANAGYKVVLTQATHLYFDHPYEPDPEERGYYWAPRFIDTRKTFGFMPDDIYANADFTRMGEPIVNLCEEMYKGKCVPLKEPQNIAGMAGALWSETVRNPSQLHSMIYPRLLALAERAWHKGCFENETNNAKRQRVKKLEWEAFANSLGHKELARLDRMNIDYHIPVPGARIVEQKLQVNSAIPGLPIQYSTDGGLTWSDVTDGLSVSGRVILGTRSADRRRLSRLVESQA
ncbi:beta-hexosaminidase-like [Montipora foliosa]|uniref:beta-hexosaminidase-like n=1 Tax=Montipora foliosa TaxID=591990 RepID=UPI0035F1C364